MKKDIIIGVLLIVLGFVFGLICRPEHVRVVEIEGHADTIVMRDTHTIEKPVPVKVTHKETLYVAVHDTTIVNDTVFVPIPIERKTYKGEDYFAEISGYKASLDRIEVYPKTTTISKTETVTQTVTNRNTLKLGIEARYSSTLSIPIYLEYEIMLQRFIGVNAGLFYDIPTGLYGVGVGANVQIGW